ncbi:hypothetical protein V5P93_004325 [Actinokineospora auranticolor]|uniref:Uncharacterized protein n=1 Tax=Actinokineospora auranticolor TaxID=155976 RepID=A0A2S6GTQ4_9PSEU|nr:hypothetical protein [Actinokineospora auranticolor]PPK68567.1 hypothetical protein CLV40_105296 [Actinokineospora auranticolor]
MTAEVDRRTVLAGVGALGLLGLLQGCTGESQPPPDGGSGAADALRSLRDAVRRSPDHLAARAAAVVAAKDADAITRFVRDNVTVRPHRPNRAAETDRRWGPAATLRAGAGTARDRVELLAALLTAAGVPVAVMDADRPAAVTVADLYRLRLPEFAPDKDLLDQVAKAAKVTVPAPTGPSAAAEIEKLAGAIVAALPADAAAAVTVRTDLLPDRLPLVRYEVGGQTRYAFAVGALDPTTQPSARVRALDPRPTTDTITVALRGLCQPAAGSRTPRGEVVTFASATWPVDRVAGHPITVTFDAAASPTTVLTAGLSAVPTRVPSLRLQAAIPDAVSPFGPVEEDPLTVNGAPITVFGDVLALDDKGMPSGPFGNLVRLSAADLDKARANARTVRVKADPSAFPEVALEVTVADGAGGSVDGLDAASFACAEDGAARPCALLSNAPDTRRPRVLVVFDGSGSITDAFPDQAARTAFNHTVAKAIVNAAATRAFDVQVAPVGATPSAGDWTPPDEQRLATSFEAFSFSEIWRSVAAGGTVGGAAVLVLISDNVSGDEPGKIAAHQAQARSHGVPVICLPVGKVDAATTDKIVELTGGARVDPLAPDAGTRLATALGTHLASRTGTIYRLRYRAPLEGKPARTVSVAVEAASGTDTYTVPAADQRIPPPSIVGVYLEVDTGETRDIRRLGGVGLTGSGRPTDDPPTAADVADARSVLDGLTTLVIEPDTPTPAAVVDDIVGAHLSWEPVRPKLPNLKPDDLADVAAGVRRYPGLLSALFAPATGLAQPDGKATTGTGWRAFTTVVVSQRPNPAEKGLLSTVDLSPELNKVGVVAADRAQALRDGVRASLALSTGESLSGDSAHGRLLDRPLRYLPIGTGVPDDVKAGLPPSAAAVLARTLDRYAGYHRLVPANGAVNAFWVVEPLTGTATAVLPDGTGGVRQQADKDVDLLLFALLIATLVAGLGCNLIGDASRGPVYYLVCIGLTIESIALTAAGVFPPDKPPTFTTVPFSVFSTLLGLGLSGKTALPGRIGVTLVIAILTILSMESF